MPILALILLAGRLIHIQTEMRPKLMAHAEHQRRATRIVPARRGTILDRCGRVLAASREVPAIFADPGLIDDVPETATRLARALSLDPAVILEKLDVAKDRRFVWIKHQADETELDGVRRLKLKGIGVRMEPKRVYPLGSSLCHVLGFVGRDHKGLEGLELVYDDRLSGQDGRQSLLVDVRRRPVWSHRDPQSIPRDGCNLVLTIDAAIQEAVERALAEIVDHFEAESGVGIVMSPKTGDVLAMASWPGYDPNHAQDAEAEHRRNRTITDPMEPGSAFKPIPGAALLNEGLTYASEVIFCHQGQARFGSRTVRDAHPFGDLTMSEVISRSSNIGMVILGERMDTETLYDYLRRFGFGDKTGIDLPGESGGLLPPLNKWSRYSAGSIMFGQELAATPIQLITAFCAIVNRGRMMTPRVVCSIQDSGGTCIEYRKPTLVRQVVRPEVAEVMTERILVQTVNEGSGRRAALRDYQVLGKTGTAQVPWKDRRGYEPGAYLASFLAAAPASDPQVCALIQVRKPNPGVGYYGSVVAAPAAGRILKWALPYLRVQPDRSNTARLAGSP